MMTELRRRSFLQLALAALPASLLAQISSAATQRKAVRVPAGTDREGKKHAIGVSSTTYKVLTQDVGETTGKLLISFTPAGKMEAFFNERQSLGIKPGAYAATPADAAMMHEFGMELVGPPMTLD